MTVRGVIGVGVNIWQVTMAGLFAGVVGTGLGGLIIASIGNPGKRILSFVLGFSGGIMLAIIFIDLLPEGLKIGGTTSTLWAF